MEVSGQRFMDYALRLGRRALGTTAENPPVGCVIVNNGDVVGVGWTQPGGRPHAETQALAMAGDAVRGATAYVTLEPCAHHGRTPSCAELLALAQLAHVVVALEDPDPRTHGKGLAILRAAGITVTSGIGAEEACRDLAGFLTRTVKGRPYVTLKLALSADGKIAAAPGERTAITGPEVRHRVHLMRAQSDAILVGAGTVRADDPGLTCRLPGLETRSPIRVVLSSKNDIPSTAKVMGGTPPTSIMSAQHGIIPVLHELAARGINNLMVEGGAKVARTFFDAGLIDRLILISSPDAIGPAGVDAFAGLPIATVVAAFRKCEEERLGRDRLTLYEREADCLPSP